MKNNTKQAFTLVELIVVITILAILWTIAFINLQWYASEARDSKRLSDVYNIQKKISLERAKWTYPSNIMKNWVDISTWLTISWNMPTDAKQWIVDFQEIKENEDDFKDPIWTNYVYSYSVWWSWTWAYKFIQLATINEQKNEALLVWDYYKIQSTDSSSIVFSDSSNLSSPLVVDWLSVLPYSIDNTWWLSSSSSSSSSWWPTPENWLCWSDNWWNFTSNPINLCNAWTPSSVTDNGWWNTYDWTCDWINWWTTDSCSANNTNLSQYPWCNEADITYWVYTISSCNVWATIAGTDWTVSWWLYFQWWNNYGSTSNWPTTSTLADATWYGPWNYYSSTSFINRWAAYRNDWTTIQNDNLWWNTIDTPLWTNISVRQWPCANWYHVPSNAEWSW